MEGSSPNSPYSTRPVTILAQPENEVNVKFLFDSMIDAETSLIEVSGLSLENGHADLTMIRSHFDTKMAQILTRCHCSLICYLLPKCLAPKYILGGLTAQVTKLSFRIWKDGPISGKMLRVSNDISIPK